MLKIFICDDNKKHLDDIKSTVEKYIIVNELATSVACAETSPPLIIKHLENNSGVGLYFLGLHFDNKINAIALAKSIRKHDPRGFIVFIASDTEAYRSNLECLLKHKVEVMDCIVKNEPMQTRIQECIDYAVERYTAKPNQQQDNFTIKISNDAKKFGEYNNLAKGSIISIESNKIICFTTGPNMNRTVIIWTTNGQLQQQGNLTQIEATLDKNHFYRCQSNLIVNLSKIINLDPLHGVLTLEGNLQMNIASRKVKGLKERIFEYSRSKTIT